MIGKRHSEACKCGCQFVIGEHGTIVQDSDTPKLASVGLAYVQFSTAYHGQQTVCYDLSEANES